MTQIIESILSTIFPPYVGAISIPEYREVVQNTLGSDEHIGLLLGATGKAQLYRPGQRLGIHYRDAIERHWAEHR